MKKYLKPEERRVPVWPQEDPDMMVLDRIRSFSESSVYPLHMPGHKRNVDRFGDFLNISLDMTESYGMADLHNASDILARRMQMTADDFGAQASYYVINGSTGAIQAAIRSLTKRREKILFGRNAHKAAYHALELCDLKPVYLSPLVDEEFGMFAAVDPQAVAQALQQDPEIKTVYITSPTFEGVISDVKTIADICHAHGARLIVDEAHGAHFHYTDRLPGDAVRLGADAVIESLHKTLPSLTSTALLHISDRVDKLTVARNLTIFETSSPSHLLIASIDECQEYMRREGREACATMYEILDEISLKFEQLEHLRVLGFGTDTKAEHPNCFALDPSKIVISCKYVTINGMQLLENLRERGFEMEMCYGDYVMGMATVGDNREGLLAFADCLLAIDRNLVEKTDPVASIFPPIPEAKMSILDAMEAPAKKVPLKEAAGLICHEYIWCYPPGIPLLLPGEIIQEGMLERFQQLRSQNIRIQSTSHYMPEAVLTVEV